MFSRDFVNKVTFKVECLYIEVKHFHFITFLVRVRLPVTETKSYPGMKFVPI